MIFTVGGGGEKHTIILLDVTALNLVHTDSYSLSDTVDAVATAEACLATASYSKKPLTNLLLLAREKNAILGNVCQLHSI